MTETVAGWPIEPGRRVRARISIWDDGADHHPPGYLCRAGDMLYVLGQSPSWFQVSHAPDLKTYGCFNVKANEISLHWEQPDLFPRTLPITHYLKEQYP